MVISSCHHFGARNRDDGMDRIPTSQVGIIWGAPSGYPYLRHLPMRLRIPTGARFDWPRTRTVHAAGNRAVGVYEYGDPAGAPVFALHGTPSNGAGFDWTDAPARAPNLPVIAPDRPRIRPSTP